MRLLARGERARLVLLTGAVMRPLAYDLLGLRCLPLVMCQMLTTFRLVCMLCTRMHVPRGLLVMQSALHGSLRN